MSIIKQSLLEKEEEMQKLKQELSQNESNYLLILALYCNLRSKEGILN